MRVRLTDTPRILEPDVVQLSLDQLDRSGAVDAPVPLEDHRHLRTNAEHRVKCCPRILEDDAGDVPAPDRPFGLGLLDEVGAVEHDLSCRSGARRQQAQDRLRGDRLPAAGLPHDTENLTALDGEVDPAHRTVGDLTAIGKLDDQVVYVDQDVAHRLTFRGSNRSLRASPKRLKDKTVRKIARPAKVEIHHDVKICPLPWATINPQSGDGG